MKSSRFFRSSSPRRVSAVAPRCAALALFGLGGLLPGYLHGQTVSIIGDVTPSPAVSPVWALGSEDLIVGVSGAGSLSIDAGGVVTSHVGYLGESASGVGQVTVSGVGSLWSNSAGVFVGLDGVGSLSILSGGQVHNTIGHIGYSPDSTGTVIVSGAGSTWSSPVNMTVGLSGTGALFIESGGRVDNGIGSVGTNAGSFGEVTVTGFNSTWTNSTRLWVGEGGTGTLNISDGGLVTSATYVGLGAGPGGSGTLNLGTGGTLAIGGADGLRNVNGTAVFNFSGGSIRVVGSSLTTSVDATLTNSSVVDTNGFNATFSGVLSGTGNLEKAGAGVLTLTGANTYTGVTMISAGTLQIGAGGETGSLGEGNVTNNAALVFDRSTDLIVANVISGTGTVTQQGAGVLTFTGANTYIGVTTISAGTLRIGDGGMTGTLGAGNVTNNAALVFDRSDDLTVTNLIAGTGTVTQQGAGALTLTRANAYSGGTTLADGTLRISHNSALGTGALTVEAGTTLASVVPSLFSSRTIANDIVVNGDFSIFPQGTMVGLSAFSLTGDIDLTGGDRTITNPSLFGASEFGLVNFGGVISNGGLALLAVPDSYAFFSMDGAQSNTYTGDTVIGEGVSLQLLKTGGAIAIAGDLFIENDGVAVVDIPEQIADTSAVTITGIGRLQVGAGMDVTETIGSLFGDGEVELDDDSLGSTLRVGAGEFSGTITVGVAGGTSLEKIGVGTLVLTGANTYLGNTVISDGVLQIGDGDTTGALGAGDVTNNASLVFDRSDDFTVANVISGAGTLTQQGTGVLTLTGANTYTGGTTITDGLIAFATAENLGTGNITLDGGGLRWTTGNTLDISDRLNPLGAGGGLFDTNGNDVTLASVISGAGQLTKDGAGALTLTGVNTYTGGTLVLGGELVVSLATLPDDAEVGAGAFLTFDQDSDGAYSGQISGAGNVRYNGDGTVTLEAVQTYTGETTINTGALQASTAILDDRNITVATGAALIVNQPGDGTYAGELDGDGGFVKTGAGTVNLTGNSTYTGPTLVNAGGLTVNGTLGNTAVTVGSGAFLGGSGTIAGDVVLQSGGFLAPGNSPGILTVGSLLLNAGSFTQMELEGAGVAGVDYDQIRVTGEATLGGTLELILGGGYVPQAGDSFVLIDADTITPGSDFDVINGLGNALLFDTTITDDFTLAITVLQTDYANFALTPNQRSVARNLDSDWTNPALLPVIDYLNALPGTALPYAFDLIAPEEYAALPRVAQSNTRAVWSNLRQRLAEIRGGATGLSIANLNLTGRNGRLDLNNSVLLAVVGDTADAIGMRALAAQAQAGQTQADERRGVFVSGTGTYGDNESHGNAGGYEFAAGGIVVGTDVRLTPDAAVGVMAGYGHSETDYQNVSSNIDMETARFGFYGTWTGLKQSWLNTTAGGAYHWYDSDRQGLGGKATGETEGTELNALVEAGRDFHWGRWTLTPGAGVDYLWLRVDGFNEHGSLAPLTVSRASGESLRSELALTLAYRIESGDTLWSPYVRAGWQHEFLDTQAAVEARLTSGAGGMFSVKGTRLERDSAILGAGIQGRLGSALDVSLAYSGELNADYQTHSVNANVRLRF